MCKQKHSNKESANDPGATLDVFDVTAEDTDNTVRRIVFLLHFGQFYRESNVCENLLTYIHLCIIFYKSGVVIRFFPSLIMIEIKMNTNNITWVIKLPYAPDSKSYIIHVLEFKIYSIR